MTTRARTGQERGLLLGVTVGAVVLDWVTKAVATVTLDDRPIEVGSIITLRLSHNPGVAFGLGDRLPNVVIIVLTASVTVALAVAVVRGLLPSRVAAALVLGGAVANLGDRVVGGTVVDFLDLGWWPSFNLADVWLSVGAALLLLACLRAPPTEPA